MVPRLDSGSIKFSIPWVPPSNNPYTRMHWSKQRKLVETAQWWIVSVVGRPNMPESRKVRVVITMHRRRALDKDNRYGACKPIFDSLVRLGYSVDDSDEWMNMEVMPVVVGRESPWTEIEITRVGTCE